MEQQHVQVRLVTVFFLIQQLETRFGLLSQLPVLPAQLVLLYPHLLEFRLLGVFLFRLRQTALCHSV
jgi:hypothetical protein